MSTATIYKLYFPYTLCELVFPSIEDIKCFFLDNHTVLDLLLQRKISIENETVKTDSKKYKIAMKNRLVLPVK